MTRDSINVHYPVLDTTESVAQKAITPKSVVVANGIKIADAFSNRNDSLFIIVDTTVNAGSSIILKAGNAYPNSMLGDKTITIPKGATAVQIQDLSRFQNTDGSVNIDFATGFVGTIYAVAKWAGIRPVEG